MSTMRRSTRAKEKIKVIRRRARIAASTVLAFMLVGIPIAAYAYGSYGAGFMHTLGSGDSTWIGNFNFSGQYVYCAGYTVYPGPVEASGTYNPVFWLDGSQGDSWTGSWGNSNVPNVPTHYGADPSYQEPLRQSGPDLNQPNTSSRLQDGRTLTGENLNRMGYVLARYGQTSNNTQASDVRMLIMEKFETIYESVWADYIRRNDVGSSLARRMWIDSVWQEAIDLAGPYDTSATTVTVDIGNQTGTLENIAAYSDAGYIYSDGTAGWRATIMSGNVVWDANGGTVLTGTLGPAPQSADFHVIPGGTGFVDIEVTYTSLPDWRVGIRTSTSGAQPVMYGRRTNLVEPRSSLLPVAAEFSINVATTTSDPVAAPGTDVTDTMDVTLALSFWDPPGYEITMTSTLYGPFDAAPVVAPAPPGGAPVTGVVTNAMTGPGTYVTDPITVTTPGYYVWHQTSPADGEFQGHVGEFGTPSEVTLVPWSPTATTMLDGSTYLPGDTITDTATIVDGQPLGTIDVTFDLYAHPLESPPVEGGIEPGAVLIDSVTETATFDAGGDATSTGLLTIPAGSTSGYMTVVLTLNGTSTMNEWISPYGSPSETGVIQWVADPSTIATRSFGNVFTDRVTLQGLPSDYGTLADEGTGVMVELFFVDRSFTGDLTTQCVPVNRIGSTTIQPTNGTQTARSSSFDLADYATPDMDGWYMYQISHPGSERLEAFTAPCGEPSETLFLVLSEMNVNRLANTGPTGPSNTGLLASLFMSTAGVLYAISRRLVRA